MKPYTSPRRTIENRSPEFMNSRHCSIAEVAFRSYSD
jgi:hypothetical protein